MEPVRDRQPGNSRQEVQAHAECGRGRWPARGERCDARFRVVPRRSGQLSQIANSLAAKLSSVFEPEGVYEPEPLIAP